jgi:hypothetical protein
MNVPVGAAGVRGLGGRGYLAYTGLGRGYHVKGDKREDKLYDLLPGMELTPMNTVSLKPQGIKLAPQVGKINPEVVKLGQGPLFRCLELVLIWDTVLWQSA